MSEQENNQESLDQKRTEGNKPSVDKIVEAVSQGFSQDKSETENDLQVIKDMAKQANTNMGNYTHLQHALSVANQQSDFNSQLYMDLKEKADLVDGLSKLQNQVAALSEVTGRADQVRNAINRDDVAFRPIMDRELLDPRGKSEPVPTNGIECFRFYVTGGTAVQAGNVFNDEFDALQMPLCYLKSHRDSDYHWHIEIYHGNLSEAREWVEACRNRNSIEKYVTLQDREQNVERIGYLHISDRPKIQVLFYVFNDMHKDKASALAYQAADALNHSGFIVSRAVQQESSLPDGAFILDDFDSVSLSLTTDELISLVRSYLQAERLVAESVSLEHKIYDNQIYIQYLFADCIIRLKTEVEKIGHTIVTPDIHCWVSNPLERERKLTKAQQHLADLITAVKKQTRWVPKKPNSTDSLDVWFDYYYECESIGHKITLKDLAKEVNISEGHLYNEHGKYKAERDI